MNTDDVKVEWMMHAGFLSLISCNGVAMLVGRDFDKLLMRDDMQRMHAALGRVLETDLLALCRDRGGDYATAFDAAFDQAYGAVRDLLYPVKAIMRTGEDPTLERAQRIVRATP